MRARGRRWRYVCGISVQYEGCADGSNAGVSAADADAVGSAVRTVFEGTLEASMTMSPVIYNLLV